MYYQNQSSLLLQDKEVWPMNPTAEEWFLSHSSISSSSSNMDPYHHHNKEQEQRPSPTPSSSSSSSNSSNSLLFDFPITTTTKMLIKPKGIRCATCKRRFHSEGNLMNHHQLYQH